MSANIMDELAGHVSKRVIGEAIIVWMICFILAMGGQDGGFVLGYYLVASFLFWSCSLIYFRSRRYYWPSDLWVFRLGPFILFVLGIVGETLAEMLGYR
ncbi:MAG: hypothetical protein HY298_15990 [Verrucomicrobia bacterium]|nr:hypothetical protein [Verrucomicrobiota bacterium]